MFREPCGESMVRITYYKKVVRENCQRVFLGWISLTFCRSKMADISLRDINGKLALYEALEQATKPSDDPALVSSRRSAGLSPSSASALVKDPVTGDNFILGSCLRQSWYKVMGQAPDPGYVDARFIRICETGDLISKNFVYEPAKKAGLWAGEEMSFFDPENMLSGRLDLMAYLPGSLEKVIVEVKSVGSYTDIPWVKSGQRGFELLEPRFKDLPQLMSYMQWWLQFGVKYGALFYCSREMNTNMFMFEWANLPVGASRPPDSAYLRCYSSERTWDLDWLTWGQIRERYTELKKHLKAGTIPPRDFEIQYSNKELLTLATNTGKGSQFVDMNATDSKLVQTRFRSQLTKTKNKDPAQHEPYVEKGSFACTYCDFKKTCWSSLGTPSTPELTAEEWDSQKRTKAPVAELSRSEAIVIPRK
jgi:hypothetical protein